MGLSTNQLQAIVDAIALRADTEGDDFAKVGLGDSAGTQVEIIIGGVSQGFFDRGQSMLAAQLMRMYAAGFGDFIIDTLLVEPTQLPSSTVATVPIASPAGRMIYVTDDVGGATPAFSDGTNWRRTADRAIVSTT